MFTAVEDEGRTVFVSSHLLDEVQKMCDAAAIVDQGRVIAQGTIAELVDPQAATDVIVGCDDPVAALAVLRHRLGIADAMVGADGVRVRSVDRRQAAQINSVLVDAQVAVWRIEPVEHSLEERFLELTSRLEAAA